MSFDATPDELQRRMMDRMAAVNQNTDRRLKEVERAEIIPAARALLRYTTATLPTPDSNMIGWKVFVTDALKPGESSSGTGAEMVCADGSGGVQWRLASAELATLAVTATTAVSANTGYSVPLYGSLAVAPAPSLSTRGQMGLFPTGRKSGEGAGLGTGVLAVIMFEVAAGDYRWVRTTDFTAVVF